MKCSRTSKGARFDVESTMTLLKEFLRNQSGATAIEYGLLASLIAVVIIGAVKLAGSNLSNKFNQIATNLS
jgi:pilus assembly protein Flp/PilA